MKSHHWLILSLIVTSSSGLVLACGDTTNVTNVYIAADAGADVHSEMTSDSSTAETSLVDAGYDGPGCANDMSPTSDDCTPGDRCGSGACEATDSVSYQCKDSGGGTRPPIDGCNYVTGSSVSQAWCCPAACLPFRIAGFCDPTEHTIACPSGDAVSLAKPDPACHSSSGTTPTLNVYCCP